MRETSNSKIHPWGPLLHRLKRSVNCWRQKLLQPRDDSSAVGQRKVKVRPERPACVSRVGVKRDEVFQQIHFLAQIPRAASQRVKERTILQLRQTRSKGA